MVRPRTWPPPPAGRSDRGGPVSPTGWRLRRAARTARPGLSAVGRPPGRRGDRSTRARAPRRPPRSLPLVGMARVLDVEQALLLLALEAPFEQRDVQLARRRMAKRWHPDIAPAGRAHEHQCHLQAINEAADQLE